jgi:pimeloyl-ACP methyl ester carboxylesterase
VPTIILVHGWQRNLERMMPYIEHLYPSFNLLAFDARCQGSSDKDSFSSMPRFAEDIESAVNFLYSQNEHKPDIGIVGLSIGGAASIYLASIDSRINKVVTVGAFADPKEVMKLQLTGHHIPHFPLGWMILNYVQFKIGKKFREFAPENNIKKSKAKILLIHGKDDLTAPYAHAERLYSSSVEENTILWGLENKGHSDCHTHPEFWNRIISFIESE